MGGAATILPHSCKLRVNSGCYRKDIFPELLSVFAETRGWNWLAPIGPAIGDMCIQIEMAAAAKAAISRRYRSAKLQ